MQIVIDITEDHYKTLQKMAEIGLGYYYDAIINGKVLPSKHGRLIDADALCDTFCDSSWNTKEKGFWFYSIDAVKNTPTILEKNNDNTEKNEED